MLQCLGATAGKVWFNHCAITLNQKCGKFNETLPVSKAAQVCDAVKEKLKATPPHVVFRKVFVVYRFSNCKAAVKDTG